MKVLFAAHYTIHQPFFGGAIRSAKLFEAVKSGGADCRFLSIYNPHGLTADPGNSDYMNVPVPDRLLIEMGREQLRPDLDLCAKLEQEAELWEYLIKSIVDYAPDVVVLEQPWLWPLFKAAMGRYDWYRPALIYSSQNVEYRLIYDIAAVDAPDGAQDIRQRCKDLELDLLFHCHGVICVSQSDLEEFQSISGKPTVLVSNGVSERFETGGLEYWKNEFKLSRFALFIGSAHPPNASGFSNLLNPDLTFLTPNQQIVVVGGVCDLLPRTELFLKKPGLAAGKVSLLGKQDDAALNTFIQLSSCIILPITSGGGTNLKTAEALFSRKPIVATEEAFRGYEEYRDFPNVVITNDPIEFKSAVSKFLAPDFEKQDLSQQQIGKLYQLTWKFNTLGVFNFLQNIQSVKKHSEDKQHLSVLDLDLRNWHAYEAESDRIWSSSRLSSIGFENCEEGYVFSANASIYSPEGQVGLLTIASDTKTYTEVELGAEPVLVEFSIEECSDDYLTIDFEIDVVNRPSDFGGNDDRLLGVSLEKVTLTRR